LLHRDKKQSVAENPETLCSNFKTFFVGKLRLIRSKIALELATYGSVLLDLRPRSVGILDGFAATTPEEVAKVINRLKCKSSPTDVIPTLVLKNCVGVFSVALSKLINLSFASGTFPTIFKIGHVIPLLKKPDLDVSDPASYRPITNLMTISKVVEQVVQCRLRAHMHQSANFNEYQSAYRPGHSTESALLKIADDLNSSMDLKSCSVLLSLDISAAFDMINIDILLNRLEMEFGIIGGAASWLRSYLTDRRYYVAIGGSRSDIWVRGEGVPQGSVLGPLIFSGYVSPIARMFDHFGIHYHQYEDDTQVYTSVRSSVDVQQLIACEEEVTRWFLVSGLLLNASKTEAIAFGTRQQLAKRTKEDNTIRVGDTDIVVGDEVKILGICLDSTLSMDNHTRSSGQGM
jgi:hypothetical protein